MLVIKFKTVLLIVITIVLAIGITIYLSNNAIIANTTPATNKIVILDAGHGAPDYGTESSSGTTEQELNLTITLKLQQLLEQSGTKVVLTRSDDNGIYEIDKDSIRSKKISDMKNRVYIGNNSDTLRFLTANKIFFSAESCN